MMKWNPFWDHFLDQNPLKGFQAEGPLNKKGPCRNQTLPAFNIEPLRKHFRKEIHRICTLLTQSPHAFPIQTPLETQGD